MWIEITLNFTPSQAVEGHERLSEEIREVLTIDKMPGQSKVGVNLDSVMMVQFLSDRAIIFLPNNADIIVHDPDEILLLKNLIFGKEDIDDEDGWKDTLPE